jgi:hypothetical protein
MKDAFDVLRQKEADLERVQREVESLRIVAPLLSEDSSELESGSGDGNKKRNGRTKL